MKAVYKMDENLKFHDITELKKHQKQKATPETKLAEGKQSSNQPVSYMNNKTYQTIEQSMEAGQGVVFE
jgi:hypothetical protein